MLFYEWTRLQVFWDVCVSNHLSHVAKVTMLHILTLCTDVVCNPCPHLADDKQMQLCGWTAADSCFSCVSLEQESCHLPLGLATFWFVLLAFLFFLVRAW